MSVCRIRVAVAVILTTLLFLQGLFSTPAQGQTPEFRIKAGLIERFTRFIEWPGDSIRQDTSLPFNILVLGKNPFGNELNQLLANTKIQGRKVAIYYAPKPDTRRFYHLVFISSNLSKSLPEILENFRNQPVVTVSDAIGFGTRGVLINLYLDQNRIRFEINQKVLEHTGLKISHHLLSMAKILQ